MKTLTANFIFLLMIFFISCSNSSDDTFEDSPPTDNPRSYNISLITDSFEGEDFVVVGSPGWNFIVAFKRELNGAAQNFEVINGSLPLIMKDSNENQYNIFGEIVNGPNSGEKLVPMNAFMGYWFAWGTFYPGLEIYESDLPLQNVGESVTGSNGWLIPRDKVFVGALRDAIPALENPEYHITKVDSQLDLPDLNHLVVGVHYNGDDKIYPHNILNWHEIVNDKINNYHYAVVFCPLTGTSTVWNRTINGQITTFGVSGFLYNNNVVPYDRNTNSNWSQMLQLCVQGNLSGENTENHLVIETNYETWLEISQNPQVMTTNTGYSREYNRNPYGSYPTNGTINFPFNFQDTRLHPKERVLGIIVNGKAKAYRFESFN